MILAYHSIVTCYGFWLPNDPRGSWSEYVRSFEIYRAGRATKTFSRNSLARRPHNVADRLLAKELLKYPPVMLDGIRAWTVGQGLGEFARKSGLVIYACAILPEHMHLVIRRHRYEIEKVINKLKGSATTALLKAGRHPLIDCRNSQGRVPSPWADDGWNVFLDTPPSRRTCDQLRPRQSWKRGAKTPGVEL